MRQEPEEKIEALSASYVPKWRFVRDGDELGSGLARLFLELYKDSLAREENMPARFKREFLEMTGSGLRKATPSQGVMVFSLIRPEMPESVLNAGTRIISQDGLGEDVSFTTQEEICVSGNSVIEVLEHEGSWYIRLAKPLTLPLYHGFLIPEETSGRDPFHLALECACPQGFLGLELSDGTQGLARDGLLVFSGWRDHGRLECMEKEGYWLRLRDQQGRRLPSKVGRLYFNAAHVKAVDTGLRTNLPAGLHHQLALTSGFLSDITNPRPFYGGSDRETRERVEKRRAARLKHRDRAVMPGDYERLALAACPLVEKARCFPGYNVSGEREEGAVTTVVLLAEGKGPLAENQRKGDNGSGDGLDLKNGEIYTLLEMIYSYLAKRCDPGIVAHRGLGVTTPLMVLIDVRAKLGVDAFYEALFVRQRAIQALEDYLTGTQGDTPYEWSVGNLPDYQRIRHLLCKVDHVMEVKRLYLTCRIFKDGRMTEVALEDVRNFPWCLPRSGTHEVTVVTGREEGDRGND